VGQLINVGQTVSDASREGARLAARSQTDNVSDVEDWVRDYLANSYPNVASGIWDSALTVSVTDSADHVLTGTEPSALEEGELVQVEVSLTFNSVRWFHGAGFGSNKVLTTTTAARRE
jgi:Flp pilus assembly protein TadG